MSQNVYRPAEAGDLFSRADWYDKTINWSARLKREIPVLIDVLGPPSGGGIIDAGCGSGRQACALVERGYRAVGADASDEMLQLARAHARAASLEIEFVRTPFATLEQHVGGGFDGLYCLGNSLAAAGTEDGVKEAVHQFGRCLRPGGRMFIQIINFPLMRTETPCVRGPRVVTVDGVEYVSMRLFHFTEDSVQITNITCFKDTTWRYRTHTGTLYPVTLDQLREWCDSSGLQIDEVYGGYAGEPFDAESSTDLILIATRV